MNKPTVYELTPTNGRKSFWGKATVMVHENGDKTLFSYGTPIMTDRFNAKPKCVRHYDGWTNTTGTHIGSFYFGMNKKEFQELPYEDYQ